MPPEWIKSSLGSSRTIDVMIALSFGALVISLVYQVNRLMVASQPATAQQPTNSQAMPTAPQGSLRDVAPPASVKPGEVLADGRIIVNVEPEYLAAFYKEHTMMQAARFLAPYIGKWMKISAPVKNVGTSNLILFERPDGWLIVVAQFNEEWADRLSVMRRGDHITVLGQIREVNSGDIRLDNCEIVDS